MRIALFSTQCNGKTTLVQNFLKKWPMYKTPQVTYRDIIKEKGIQLNRSGDAISQRVILDALVEETISHKDVQHVIFDRSIADNLAYTLWHYARGNDGFDDSYIIDARHQAAKAFKHLDVIFYLPLAPEIEFEPKENRDDDPDYRVEIDNIMKAMVGSYEKGTGAFFPAEDCPAVITLGGPADLRLEQMRLYIKDSGAPFGEEDGSLIQT